MKKPKLLNKLTIIDILIIICIIGAVGFAIFHMTDDDSSDASATSFDVSTENKIVENYLSLYQKGNKIESTVVGSKSSTGENVKISGNVLWLGENGKDKPNLLIDNNGEKVLAGFYKDTPNADVYIDQISLETNGDKHSNISDIKASPKKIKSFNDLISGIPKNAEYEISTELAIDELDSLKYQQLINALNRNKKPCIVLKDSESNTLEINRASKEDFKIAENILKDFDGQTSEIQIRIYNSTSEDTVAVESAYNVLSIAKTTN